MKRKIKFCWYCGRKLYGNIYATKVVEGYERILHKQCKEFLETGHPRVSRDDELLDDDCNRIL